jgi:hypothetical protein
MSIARLTKTKYIAPSRLFISVHIAPALPPTVHVTYKLQQDKPCRAPKSPHAQPIAAPAVASSPTHARLAHRRLSSNQGLSAAKGRRARDGLEISYTEKEVSYLSLSPLTHPIFFPASLVSIFCAARPFGAASEGGKTHTQRGI